MKMESHPIIDGMKESVCCLKCRTLSDPFVGCVCNQELLRKSKQFINAVTLPYYD